MCVSACAQRRGVWFLPQSQFTNPPNPPLPVVRHGDSITLHTQCGDSTPHTCFDCQSQVATNTAEQAQLLATTSSWTCATPTQTLTGWTAPPCRSAEAGSFCSAGQASAPLAGTCPSIGWVHPDDVALIVASSGRGLGPRLCFCPTNEKGGPHPCHKLLTCVCAPPHPAQVGVSRKLLSLNEELRAKNAFVPHGQCSHVNIGGHCHTGGYGLPGRAFGLFGDHIIAIRCACSSSTPTGSTALP